MLEEDLTSVEVLGLAIAQEVEAHKRYQLMADMIANPLVKEKFRSLAREEKAHREMLYNLLKKYSGESKPKLPKKAPRANLGFDANLPVAELIMKAVDKEREAKEFYLNAAKRSNDQTGKRILHYLALFEEGHERSLLIEYETVAKFPLWFEMSEPDFDLVTA